MSSSEYIIVRLSQWKINWRSRPMNQKEVKVTWHKAYLVFYREEMETNTGEELKNKYAHTHTLRLIVFMFLNCSRVTDREPFSFRSLKLMFESFMLFFYVLFCVVSLAMLNSLYYFEYSAFYFEFNAFCVSRL